MRPTETFKRTGADKSRFGVGEEKAEEGGFDESKIGRTTGMGRRWRQVGGKVQFEGKVGIGSVVSGRGPRRKRGKGRATVPYDEPCLED